MSGFKVIGFSREFGYDSSQTEIPKFRSEICGRYQSKLFRGKAPENELERAVILNRIGEFGVCVDDIGKGGRFCRSFYSEKAAL